MNRFMKRAIREAYRGIEAGDGGPFGAVIVKDGRVVAACHNEVIKRSDPTCHGEIMAIRRAAKRLGSHDLSGCEIYTTGEPTSPASKYFRLSETPKTAVGVPRRSSLPREENSSPKLSKLKKSRFIFIS